MTLNGAMMRALADEGYSGSLNGRLLAFYRDNGVTAKTLNKAELEFLRSLGVTGDTLNDAWLEYLRGFGLTGSMNDMLFRFWKAGGFGAILGILTVGSSGTQRGYEEGAYGGMDPNTIEGATVYEFSADDTGACVLSLGDGTEQLPGVDRIDVDIEGFGGLTYTWNATNTQYEATSLPLFTYLDSIVGRAIDLLYTVFGTNMIPNSVWSGMSGSIVGGDWVFPTDWDGGFWPPTDAIALPEGRIQFITESDRGYISLQIPVEQDQVYNLSVYIDEVIVPNGQRACQMQGSGNLMTPINEANLSATQAGRRWGIWRATRTDVCNIRIGAGTTAVQSQNFTCSRPQVTLGEELRPYRGTEVTPVPTFTDSFTDVAGTLLSAHTPDLGAGWLTLGSELGITAANTAQARGTGTGTGNPNYWSNLMDVPAPVGRKLITFNSSSAGGTSLSQGFFAFCNAATGDKVICGIINTNMVIQSWQGGSFTNELTVAIPDAGQSDAPYPEPFFVILEGDLLTIGYGDWRDPIASGTYDTSALTGLGDGMGLLMRASGPDGIYDIEYADI